MVTVRIADDQRRARLVARQHLGRTAASVADVLDGVVASHSSDPATPYLAAWARIGGFRTSLLDQELYEQRSAWRLHAMRRTLFVVAAREQPMFDLAVGRDNARKERTRVEHWLAAEIGAAAVPAWLADVEARIADVLADGTQRRIQDLTAMIPDLAAEVTLGSGRWTTRAPIGTRLLYVLGLEGRVVRTRPAGTWRSSQYHWAAADRWFAGVSPAALDGSGGEPMDDTAARAELARRYLATHGPATLDDLRWWAGWTVRQAAAATERVGAVAVALDGGLDGLALPGDLDELAGDGPAGHVALLPGLDSAPMGYRHRNWFLGPHGPRLFDRNGNAGPTVWVDGRVVGGWAQRGDGEVVVRLLEDVGRDATARVDAEVAALTAWLDGVVVVPRFRTPLERELSS